MYTMEEKLQVDHSGCVKPPVEFKLEVQVEMIIEAD